MSLAVSLTRLIAASSQIVRGSASTPRSRERCVISGTWTSAARASDYRGIEWRIGGFDRATLSSLSLWERVGVRTGGDQTSELNRARRARTAGRNAPLRLPSPYPLPQAGEGKSTFLTRDLLGFARDATRDSKRFEFLAELSFEPALGRLVERCVGERIRQALLIQRHAAFDVMVVSIILAVAEAFHQSGRRIAQVQRHVERSRFADGFLRPIERHVCSVALRCNGEIERKLGETELAFGTAEAVVGVPRVERHAPGTRIGQANVLDGHARHASREIERTDAAVEHARQPVQRRV